MSNATNSADGEIVLSGDFAGGTDATYPQLRASGVTPGTYAPVQRLSVDSKGRVVSVGQTIPSDISGLISDADTVSKGLVQIGSGLTISSGIVSVVFQTAYYTNKGGLIVGSGFAVSSGIISLSPLDATAISKGVMQPGTGLTVTSGVLSANSITQPDATLTTKGQVQIGVGFDVVSGSMSTQISTLTSKGTIQVGSGLNVSSGVVSLATLPDATLTTKGQVQIGSGLSVTSGIVSVTPTTLPDATLIAKGIVQIGSGLSVTSGVVSATIPVATTSTLGLVKASSQGLDSTIGTLSLVSSASGVFGGIQIGSGLRMKADLSTMIIDQTVPAIISSGFNSYGSSWVSGTTGLQFSTFAKAIVTPIATPTTSVATSGTATTTLTTGGEVFVTTTEYNTAAYGNSTSAVLRPTYQGGFYYNAFPNASGAMVRKSSDLFVWTDVVQIFDTSLSSVRPGMASNGSTLLLMGSSSSFISTDSGATWNGYSIGRSASYWSWPIWNGSYFMGTAYGNIAAKSPDGITWTTTGTTGPLEGASGSNVWNGSRFVNVNPFNSTTFYSTDGITWTSGGAVDTHGVNGVTWNGTYFVANGTGNGGGSDAAGYISTNGVSWTGITLPGSSPVLGTVVALGTTLFVVRYVTASSNYAIFRSTNNGTSWTQSAVFATDGTNFYGSPLVINSLIVLTGGIDGNGFYAKATSTDGNTNLVTALNHELPASIVFPSYASTPAGKRTILIVQPTRDVRLSFDATAKVGPSTLLVSANTIARFTFSAYSKTGTTAATNWLVTSELV